MSFKHRFTGVIETPNEKLVSQYTKRPELWEEVKAGKTPKTKTENKGDKGPDYKELKEIATAMGLEFAHNIKKDDLIEIIRTAQAEAEQNESDEDNNSDDE